MTTVIRVRFKDSGRTYHFSPGELDLHTGDMVIVDTIHGPELAKVVYEQSDIPNSDVVGDLKSVIRRAETSDFEVVNTLDYDYDEIIATCNQKIVEHDLGMHLVKAEYNFCGSRLTFYFTAEQRVDFRALVRDLARTFKTRIELRQIGPRDEAKFLGGIGLCGRLLCCSTFLPEYAKVSIRMAKDQELPLNPAKISGICNRLLCCLSYEHQQYVELKESVPRRGTWVQTVDGKGEVVGINILQQQITVQLAHSGMQEQYTVSDVQIIKSPMVSSSRSDEEQDIFDLMTEGDIDVLHDYDLNTILHTYSEATAMPTQESSSSRQDSRPWAKKLATQQPEPTSTSDADQQQRPSQRQFNRPSDQSRETKTETARQSEQFPQKTSERRVSKKKKDRNE
jgi:cell fate regulator YaaT (PSP1 superfamily)